MRKDGAFFVLKNSMKLYLSKQKRILLILEWSVGFRPAGSVWLLLLALRGFSLVEIGFAEAVFHVVSLCCELPSGILADVLGRKRALTASHGMFVLSTLLMVFSQGMAGVCLSLAFSALGYNLESGTREAITYESMLQVGQEADYLKFSALQHGVYRFSSGGAMLLAGATVYLGWRTAYLLDMGITLIGLVAALAITEPERGASGITLQKLPAALVETVRAAWILLRSDGMAVRIMVLNALVGACATLTGFYLQEKVQAAVTVPALLGPALFALGLGGGLAGLLTGRLDRLPYPKAAAITGAGVLLCAWAARGTSLPVLMVSGLLAGLLDDSLELVTDKNLNNRFPSAQRATLISISSMVFSVFMIPLSPLFGWWFS